MTTYLGVGAVRIQTWLAHTPKLTHLRGASQALHEYAANAAVQKWLDAHAPTVTIEPSAGDVDGVVALVIPPDVEALSLAEQLVSKMHRDLPAVQWSAWWCDADGYLQALSRSTDPDDTDPANPMGRLDFLPRVQDTPFVESCPQCRRETLSVTGVKAAVAGADCAARDAAQQKAIAANKKGTTDWAGIPGQWPTTFDELAAEGGLPQDRSGPQALGRRDSRSHLATIAADGNGIGGLVHAIASCSVPLDGLYAGTVTAVNTVMANAVTVAAGYAGDDRAMTKVVIPHYVGGDDALVSVPAAAAWVFAARLAEHFGTVRATLTRLLEQDLAQAVRHGRLADSEPDDVRAVRERIGWLSLGVGIVFAPTSHPFADSSTLAHERALHEAKKAAGGRHSRIGWIDLTADSSGLGGESGAVPSIPLDRAISQLTPGAAGPDTDIFALTPSARSQLGSILRDTLADTPAARQAAVDLWAKRTQVTVITPLADLPAALSRARWWPASNLQEEDR